MRFIEVAIVRRCTFLGSKLTFGGLASAGAGGITISQPCRAPAPPIPTADGTEIRGGMLVIDEDSVPRLC